MDAETAARFEDELVKLNGRVDTLGHDMRQSFRVMNDRLSGIAA
ncbi:MAG: hypothetical protein R6U63_01160 [Longimicrobiales bacterium]